MKLDFSRWRNLRESAGTSGDNGDASIHAGLRVPTRPARRGDNGDKPAAVALAADLVVAVPAACPQVSPACPQVTDAEKLNAGAVSPASPLVPVKAAQGAAVPPFEREDAAGKSTGAGIKTCVGCLHLLRRGTCGEPVAAGLLTEDVGFGIVWPPEGHGAACPAFIGKMPTAAADRPHRLTNDEADRCHAPCWDDAEIAAFTARTERFALLGRADADDLAERLTLRDRQHDDRRLCLECVALADNGRCLVAARGRLPGASRRLEPVPTMLQRCEGFTLAPGLT
jgi:hypothetical protein